MVHVAIVHKRYIDPILQGRKRVEVRLSRVRCAPFGRVAPGERIYFKASSGPFAATAVVGRVQYVDSLTPASVRALERSLRVHAADGDRAYWKRKARAQYATLVWIRRPEPVAFGPDLEAFRTPGSRQAWLVLPDRAEVYPRCLLTRSSG